MTGTSVAKRKAEETKLRSLPNKRFKKQVYYSSGSSDSEDEVSTPAAFTPKVATIRDKRRIPPSAEQEDDGDGDDDDDDDNKHSLLSDTRDRDVEAKSTTSISDNSVSDSDADSSSVSVASTSDAGAHAKRRLTKRHDPSAFASAISAILDSKAGKTQDPILARSKAAADAAHSHAEAQLEARAKRKLRDEKRTAADKGRVRNVLLGDRRRTPGLSESEAEESGAGDTSGIAITRNAKSRSATKPGGSSTGQGASAAEITEQERRLRKTAQRGVVKLFNAVRAAQVKAEEAARETKQKGIVGVKQREETVGEMGRQAFLNLVGAGKMDMT